MLIKRAEDIKTSEITDETIYREHRDFLCTSSGAALAVVVGIY